MLLSGAFAAALSRLLPHSPPRLALGVSGGADSSALALLADEYCRTHGGTVLALIVDHGLRAGAAAEAALTASRLAQRGIAAKIITLALAPGPGVQARARDARHAALAAAAREAGFLYLALGHHAADQRETVAMRAARGEGGAEGMAAWAARRDVVLLCLLLRAEPESLRAYLTDQGMGWIEDPSNQSRRFERVRIRQDAAGLNPDGAAARAAREAGDAAFLARHAEIYPEGFALLDAGSAPPSALGALLRTLGGKRYPPRRDALARLAGMLRPATLGGVRIAPAGRLGPGWLLAREPAACAAPIAASSHALWDGRFTLLQDPERPATLGALGAQAAAFHGFNGLPTLVLRGLPALRPASGGLIFPAPVRFSPTLPASQAPFRAGF